MTTVPVTQARIELADLVSRVAYGSERIELTRYGKVQAILISKEDYELLRQVEDLADRDIVRERLATLDQEGTISHEQLVAELERHNAEQEAAASG
jgi:prevent-host-death family protein